MTETCLPIVQWLKNWFTTTDDLLDKIYPVGSIYMTTDSTKNPNNLFDGTSWTKLEGRFLLGSGTTSGTSTSYTSGATDGEATHTLTQNEMPNHSHTFNHYQNTGTTTTYSTSWTNQKTSTSTTSGTGGNQPHNNMPPYLVVNMWQRTA